MVAQNIASQTTQSSSCVLTATGGSGNLTHNVEDSRIHSRVVCINASSRLDEPMTGARLFESSAYERLDRAVANVLLGGAWLVTSISVVGLIPATVAVYRSFDLEVATGRSAGLLDFAREFARVFKTGAYLTMVCALAIGVLGGLLAALRSIGVSEPVVRGAALTWFAAIVAALFNAIALASTSEIPTVHVFVYSAVFTVIRPITSAKVVGYLATGVAAVLLVPASMALVGSAVISCVVLRRCHRLWHRQQDHEIDRPLEVDRSALRQRPATEFTHIRQCGMRINNPKGRLI